MKFLVFLISILVRLQPATANHFEINGQPNWVKSIEIPSSSHVSKYDVVGGAYSALIDQQKNVVEEADFTHLVFNVLTNGGVKTMSEISIPYDTAYQRVEFHYLYVWRNGKKVDRTGDLTFEFLRNESLLDLSMYTGRVTAYEILEDIRRGDKLEYAYTIIGDNPIFEKQQFQFQPLIQTNPVDYVSVRFLLDKKIDYTTRCNACDSLTIVEYETEDFRVIELTQKNLPAGDFEKSMPAWIMPYTYFSISSYDSWEEVNQWANSVFEIETTPDISALIAEIKESHNLLNEQIDAAINYVQDDIRYMALENGIGSIKPFPPSQVVKQRFGDCKDKSLLLVTLLKGLGVAQAYPALVSVKLLKGVENMLPGAHVFDHCIVHFMHEGSAYWIDPTFSLQGGTFDKIGIPDYGKAMIVGNEENGVVTMGIVDSVSGMSVNEVFTFADFEKPGFFEIEKKYFGLVADYMRASLEYLSRKELSDQYRKNYGRLFTSIQKDKPVEIIDDVENNVITTIETYFLLDSWKEFDDGSYVGSQFRYEPTDVYNYIGQSECEVKEYPVKLSYPNKFSQTTIINLPDRLKVESDKIYFNNAGFTYKHLIIPVNGKTVRLTYDFATKTDELAAKDYLKTCQEMNEISRQIALVLNYSSPKLNNEAFRRSLKSFQLRPSGTRLNR